MQGIEDRTDPAKPAGSESIAPAGAELFAFGKFRGATFAEVAQEDQGYCRWAQSQQSPNGQLVKFVEYLEWRQAGQQEQQMPGKSERPLERKRALADDPALSDEQLARIAANRLAALERKRLRSEPHGAPVTCPSLTGHAMATGSPGSSAGTLPTERAKRQEIDVPPPDRRPVATAARSTAHRTTTLRVQHRYLELISSGRKRWEGRLNVGGAASLSIGSKVTLSSGRNDLNMVVRSVRKYANFQAMLCDLGLETCLPGVRTVAEGVAVYHRFPGYAQKEVQFGVIAFELMPSGASFTLGF